MTAGSLSSADGKSHDPQNEQHQRGDPQQMYGEPGTEEDQDEQQREYEHHEEDSFSVDPSTPGSPGEVRRDDDIDRTGRIDAMDED
jgi:hypothetical protein